MAQRTTVVLTDDIDGDEASETVQFGFEGVGYEIDLNAANAEKLRRGVSLYVEHARRVGGRRGSGTAAGASGAKSPDTGSGVDNGAVRAWARENGIEVSDRGRIKSEIVQQYRDAQG